MGFVEVEEAWKHNKGENVKVAILDTGWFPHKDLINNFIEGYDATGNNDYLDHGNFHSVHVAGIIAANSSADSFGVTGIAPMAKLVPIKVLEDSGNGSYEFVRQGLEIVKNIDVDVVNMSLGASVVPSDDSLHQIIKEIVDQGKIIVCAAGNDGGSVNYPAKYDETIAVAAVQQQRAKTVAVQVASGFSMQGRSAAQSPFKRDGRDAAAKWTKPETIARR
ncbi:MAG: hypothetical protein EBX66_05205 [Betaproteobacteria bacterium]|nr:hypothetical protein [Betaproteobacteria bacterium]